MKIVTTLALTLCCQLAQAQAVPDSPAKEHELQLGLATATSSSIYVGGSTQTRVFPAIDYQYNRFYIQAGDVGFNLVDTKSWEVDFGLGVDLVGDTERGDSRLLRDLPDLGFPVNAFVAAQYISPIGLFRVKYNHEINNKHNGNGSSISYAAPIFKGKWLIMPQLAYDHYSEEVINYFFGVNPIDATTAFPAYQTGSAQSYSLSLLAVYEMNDKWSLVGNLKNEYYSDEITNSPIVDDDQRWSAFAGVLYKFF